jgi:carboxymethylenebutenolidase
MAVKSSYEPILVGAEHEQFSAFCALPEGGSGPGILLFHEVFGINDNIRQVAERLADQGYITIVPDMFWRLEPRFERKDESGLGDALALVERFDVETAVTDIQAAHAYLASMPECSGKIGAVGFCLGGALSFAAASTSRVEGRGLAAAVCYYGSGINDLLHWSDGLECPTMLHYGNEDPFISAEKIAEVERVIGPRVNLLIHRYDAGHAFSNWDSPSMYNEEAADAAWISTLKFLTEYLS